MVLEEAITDNIAAHHAPFEQHLQGWNGHSFYQIQMFFQPKENLDIFLTLCKNVCHVSRNAVATRTKQKHISIMVDGFRCATKTPCTYKHINATRF